jgi:two-component system, cell cycle response regulator DivK
MTTVSPRTDRRRAAVLVVDDQRDARDMVAEYLSFRGFVVETATDGLDALDVAVRVHPAVILMDLTMPRMDGWEATRRLKADSRTRDIPVIALSAHSPEDANQRAQAAGCADYIAKPCDLDHLAGVLRVLLNQPKRTRRGTDIPRRLH